MRGTAALLLTTAILLTPASLHGQQWDDQQQEVLDSVIACWDTWMDAVRQNDADVFTEDCQAEDATFWVGSFSSPILEGPDYLRRNWGGVVGIDQGWVDLRPISISVHDDVAVIHFYGLWQLPEAGVVEWKRTEVWRREDGRWVQWAGHATPVDDD